MLSYWVLWSKRVYDKILNKAATLITLFVKHCLNVSGKKLFEGNSLTKAMCVKK